MERKENVIVLKSEAFADRINNMCNYLQTRRGGSDNMIRQISKSGTSIGANIAESVYAQSGPDFISKLSIALKEANETRYWLDRLYAVKRFKEEEYSSVLKDNLEIIYILTSIIKTMKTKQRETDAMKNGEEIKFIDEA